MTRPVSYLVESTRDGQPWQPVGAPMVRRDAAILAMTAVARMGGERVYGPEGTSRLRVRAVTR